MVTILLTNVVNKMQTKDETLNHLSSQDYSINFSK